jgi:primosomal protein N''
MEAAAQAKDEALQQELKIEREEMDAKIAKAEEDRARLAQAVIKAKQGALEKLFSKSSEGLAKCAEAGEKVGGTAGGITLVAIGIFPSEVSAAIRAVL